MEKIIPEIEDIVNFYTPEIIEDIARETGFVQRESKLGGMEFLGLMFQGLYANPNATLNQMAGMLKDINSELQISGPGIQQRIVGSDRDFLKRMLSVAMKLCVSSHGDSLCGDIPELLKSFIRWVIFSKLV